MGKPARKHFFTFPREIRGSLLLAFCLLLLLFLSLGSFALQQVQETQRRTELIGENYEKGSLILSQLGEFAFNLDMIAKERMKAAEPNAEAQWEERFTRTKVQIDSYIAENLRASLTGAEQETWQELQKVVDEYCDALQKTFRQIQMGRKGSVALLSDTGALTSQRKLQALSAKLSYLHEKAARKHQEKIFSGLGRFRTRTLFLTGLTLLLGILIMVLSLRDIQAKADRIRNERDFSKTLIQAIGDGVALFDLAGRIEFANRKFADMTGYTPEEILGKTCQELFPAEDLPQVDKQHQALRNNEPSTFESQLIRANGSSFSASVTSAPLYDEMGQPLGWVSVFRDITRRKETERLYQELARALEETDESVVITDLEEKITYVNVAAERTYGYQIGELIGHPTSILRTLNDHLFLGTEIRAGSLSKGWRGELMNRRKGGEVFPICLTTSPIRDGKGHPCAIVGISQDISERKRIEQEILNRNRELASLNAIAAAMSESLDLHQTLEKAVERIWDALDLDGCEIYIWEGQGPRPVQVACRGMEKDYFQQQSLPGIEPAWQEPIALTDEPILVNDLQKEGIHLSLLSQGFLSFASIPIKSKGVILGALNAARKRLEGFTDPEIALLSAIGNQMGMFIENVRSFEREKRRVEELSSLIEVAQAVNSSLDLEKVLESIVRMAAKVMNAPAANLMLLDDLGGELRWSANVGVPAEWIALGNLKVGQSLSGLVVSSGEPLATLEMSKDPRFLYPELARKFGFHSFLGVPLISREKPIGGLYICTTEPHPFSKKEIRLLSALSNQAALAIENARLFRETEDLARENLKRYHEVSILNEMGEAMRSTIRLDQILPVILTGVTFGGGLGFNRAILFLVDERGEFLEGVLGMGPNGPEDAFLIWNQLETKRPSLLELSQTISWEALTQSPFHLFASSLKVPLTPDAGIIARTAIEKRSFNIQDSAQPDLKVHAEYEGRLGARAFAAVPLPAKDKIIGVILVDNLYNGRPIMEDDLRFLATLANQAGMAIETARLYSHLEEANRQLQESHYQIVQLERLATLGEMSALVAHQIRNPLVSIGGFARRLSQLTPENADHQRYLDIIQKEVKRLEEMVKELLTVSPEVHLRFGLADLNQIVRECLILHDDRVKRQRVNLRTQLDRKLPKIFLDVTRMRQALSNLLDNALDVMPNGGDLFVSTFSSAEAAHLEVADNGPGIAPGNLQAIFDPFFTTKVDGTGLGLPLTQRIISHHRGKIEARNLPQRGAAFSISLPLSVNPLTVQGERGGD